MTGWAAFWILCAVFVVCEFLLASRGIDTLLWQFRTPAEKALQWRLINAATPSAEGAQGMGEER